MSEYVWFIVDDWQGLYKDGKCVMEGHDLHPVWFAKELGIALCNYDENIDDYLMENGRFPDNIEDLPDYELE